MTGDKVTAATVVMPLSLMDFVKALRELMGVFRDATGFVVDGVNLIRRNRAGKAAADLDYMGFPPHGFLRSLSKIASGQGSTADGEKLQSILDATADGVTSRLGALGNYRETVRKDCGAAAGAKLDAILHGPEGKFVIRYEIEGLIHMVRDGKPPADQSAQAKSIIEKIAAFNEHLIELHDSILPPRGAPKSTLSSD